MQVAAAHVEQVCALKIFAVARRSAIVWRDHHVSLIYDVLNKAVEGVHALRRRPAVDVNDGGVLSVALHIARDV